jgi:hypothetical protein
MSGRSDRSPTLCDGASRWEPSRVVPAARHNDVLRDRSEIERPVSEQHPEPYRGIFHEPPYSIWQASVGLTIIMLGRLLWLSLSGQ